MARSKVLVTGAAGFIAFHLIESLLRSGQEVVGIDNFDAFYGKSIKEKNLSDLKKISNETRTPFAFHLGDIRDFGFEMLSGTEIESIVHLAAKAGVRPSLDS